MSRKLIERYIITALLPYMLLSLVVLTSILLTQQANKFAEIMGTTRAPLFLAVEIMLAILPQILIFTLPMAMLVGTATGFSRLGSDSEMVAMRSAGVGTWRIVLPVLLLGASLSALTLYVCFDMGPAAARELRDAAMRAALYKLESPVEPRNFYTEMPGKVVYVRDGDHELGQWGRVFIHWQEAEGQVRLVTARSGRIDVTEDRSELVLTDALITTLPPGGMQAIEKGSQVTTERSAQLRVRDDRLNTGRSTLLKRMREREIELDEMGLSQLLRQTEDGDAQLRRNAAVMLHKKLSLCAAPLVFAFFGSGIGLRMRRGGRAVGVVISLITMLAYYLVSVAGEQMGRVGVLPAALGAWLAFIVFVLITLLLIGTEQYRPAFDLRRLLERIGGRHGREAGRKRPIRIRYFLGLFDKSITGSLGWNFAVTFLTMTSIFLIFTLFELLRFIAPNNDGWGLASRYLFYLLPFVGVAVAPLSTLLAVLITYTLLIRRNEAIAWWASGQSVYRLLVPALLFGACIGLGLWVTQERVMPAANRLQNALRSQIRNGPARTETPSGRQWLATADTRRLYSYEYEQSTGRLLSPVIYEFDEVGIHLERIKLGRDAYWEAATTLRINRPETIELSAGNVRMRQREDDHLTETEPLASFKPEIKKPSEMNLVQLSDYIRMLKRRRESGQVQVLSTAFERKRADPFSPLVMVLVGAPLAVSFGSRSTVRALFLAVLTGLAFWGMVSGFQQLGNNGLLPPAIAAWGPLSIFAAVGMYLLSRVRT